MSVISNPALPSESEVFSQIREMECRRGGNLSFIEMFLATIPESAKIPENDDNVMRLFSRVERAMFPPEMIQNGAVQTNYPHDWSVIS